MVREIECKVAISNAEVAQLANRIDTQFPEAVKGKVHKEDTYYGMPAGRALLFRIRKDQTGISVTKKKKDKRSDGAEVNQEIEFSVPSKDLSALKYFFLALGYIEKIKKRKIGMSWQQDTLTIELVEVEHLGWFLEIEKLLAEQASDATVAATLEYLAKIRKQLGVGDYPLQGRYYSEMLQDI